jgi:multiple sugar transport system permease protein
MLMLVPAAVLLVPFYLFPAAWAAWTSLTDRALLGFGATETRFVGLDNYRRLLDTPDIGTFTWNTVVFVAGTAIFGQTLAGLGIALLLEHGRRHRYRLVPIAYAAVLVAWISPPAFAATVWGNVYDYQHGLLNTILRLARLEPVEVLWDAPMLGVIIAESWRGVAFPMVIFAGALRTIPAAVYEAAAVDGASRWRMLSDVTLPIVSHLIAVILLLTTIVATGSFILILILTNGDPGYQTETLALFAFHRAFGTYEIGFGAAISMAMLGVNLAAAAIYLRLARVDT